MLAAIIEALGKIIDLRKAGREDKKTGLEIKKLENEMARDGSLVTPATFGEVKEFDFKFKVIQRKAKTSGGQDGQTKILAVAPFVWFFRALKWMFGH
jgi:hypothetical protein